MFNLVRKFLRMGRKGVASCRRTYWTWRVRHSAAECGKNTRANFRSSVTRTTHIKDFVNFNGMSVRGNGRVTFGSYFHSGQDCLIVSSFHNYDEGSFIPYGPKSEDKDLDVTIEDFVWLGDRCIILGGVRIGEGAIIQAGSVVVSDVPPLAIAGGHPARVFRERDRAHFERLKAEGKFL